MERSHLQCMEYPETTPVAFCIFRGWICTSNKMGQKRFQCTVNAQLVSPRLSYLLLRKRWHPLYCLLRRSPGMHSPQKTCLNSVFEDGDCHKTKPCGAASLLKAQITTRQGSILMLTDFFYYYLGHIKLMCDWRRKKICLIFSLLQYLSKS